MNQPCRPTVLDIELRFVAHTVPALEFGEGIVRTVRVLQWRKLLSKPVMSGAEWTSWDDVPFVEDVPGTPAAASAGALKGDR